MSTSTRPELSEKNQYYLPKHRYYELKHFCLQYPTWKKSYNGLDGLSKRPADLALFVSEKISDPTARCAESKLFFLERIEMIESVAKKTDLGLWNYIIVGVTEDLSYDKLNARDTIPCCRDCYYELYRKFFWLLDKARQ